MRASRDTCAHTQRPGAIRRAESVVGAAVLALGALTPLTAAPSQAAQDVSLRPTSGVFTVQGRGYGHGRGMSQWGAYGAATSGLSWQQILDFYYPGTVRKSVDVDTMRVWISGDNDGTTTVLPAPGLTVQVGATRRALPAGPGVRAWKATRSGTALAVSYLDAAGTWRPYAVPASRDVAFAASAGTVRLVRSGGTSQELRGAVHAVLDAGTVRSVLHTSMESYLRGVVPSEMPASWHTQALAAQSVAARTYAASYRARQWARGAVYDICDSQTCQMFSGTAVYTPRGVRVAKEDPRSDEAVALTTGTVLRTSANPSAPFAFAEFSASNGGYTVAGGPFYQVAKPDPYDGKLSNPSTSWSRPVAAASIERAFGVGALRAVRVVSRDGRGAYGGRVNRIAFEGTRGTVTKTGMQVRVALGLKSEWFAVSGGATTTRPVPPASSASRARPVRDFDSDGRPDLVSIDSGDGSLWLRNVAADGTLLAARRLGGGWAGMNALVAVGQFDGRGGQDLIAREAATGTLWLYPGDGTGALGRRVRLGAGYGGITSLTAVGDADGNGVTDLVGLRGRTRQLVIVPGRAGGRLGPARVIANGVALSKVAGAGDVDGDGRGDLVGVTSTRGELTLYAGSRTGTFARRAILGRGWEKMRDLTSVGDVTGDGRWDLLVHDARHQVLLYPNVGGAYGASRVVARGVTLAVPGR